MICKWFYYNKCSHPLNNKQECPNCYDVNCRYRKARKIGKCGWQITSGNSNEETISRKQDHNEQWGIENE